MRAGRFDMAVTFDFTGPARKVSRYIRGAWTDEGHRFQQVQKRNIETLRHRTLQEISGAFGDLGTLLPILFVLADGPAEPIYLASTLVFSGIANILTGIMFGIPLPVQPMKSIAAVAIAENFNEPQVASAGLFVAAVIGFLSITGLLRQFNRIIPVAVVKGIQVGTGFSLIISSRPIILFFTWSKYQENILSIAILLFLLFCTAYPRVPFVLVIVLAHLPLVWKYNGQVSLWSPITVIPSLEEFRVGAFGAGLGQIPLTALNSIIAVTSLSSDLLPDIKAPSATALGLSVSAINLVGCWFGAMPVCHGSGGLAAQFRFGARSGSSIILLGLLKLALGLFASDYALAFCRIFHKSTLAILLFLAGFELVRTGENLNTAGTSDLWEESESQSDIETSKIPRHLTREERMRRWTLMMVTVGVILATKNTGKGFLAGMVLHWIYTLLDHWESWRAGREGRILLEDDSPSDESPTHSSEQA